MDIEKVVIIGRGALGIMYGEALGRQIGFRSVVFVADEGRVHLYRSQDVISNGRQDYMNYVHNMREMTMEVSSEKKLPSENLQRYWNIQGDALINYIKEVFPTSDTIPDDTTHIGIDNSLNSQFLVYPNPTRGEVFISTWEGVHRIDLSDRPAGIYILNIKGRPYKVIKL